MTSISGKKILLGITGGIAAYKSAELLRLLVKAGADVKVVMTKSAAEFVAPLTFQTLSGKPVMTDLFSAEVDSGLDHIRFTDEADLFIVAPATANSIGKITGGIGDDALSTLALAFDGPFLIAPAMNAKMYRNPFVQENLEKLKKHGYKIVGPESGDLACSYQDVGRMSQPSDILEAAISALTEKTLAGKKILITAGPTQEAIDPVRFIGNRSSGKMGYALATEALRRGADVTLISGPVAISPPTEATFIKTKSAKDMSRAVNENMAGTDIMFMVAAVADFSPVEASDRKIKKGSNEKISLELQKTIDILGEAGKTKDGLFLVGFAAETDKLRENASSKLKEKNLDLIIANDVSEEGVGFDTDTNRVTILDSNGLVEETELLSKEAIASNILNIVEKRLA